jgi:hypothetical protein
MIYFGEGSMGSSKVLIRVKRLKTEDIQIANKFVECLSVSLIIRKIYFTTSIQCHYIPPDSLFFLSQNSLLSSVGEDVD